MIRNRPLFIRKSKLYAKGVVVTDPVSEETVNSFGSRRSCERWMRRNGYMPQDDPNEK
jgi:hypothetical protein